jgi:Tfp pilus assembly protein PilP
MSAGLARAYGEPMRRLAPTVAAVLIAITLTGCGESEEENAQQTVCDARQDISNQVNSLKGLTPATISTDAVSENLEAIRSDLSAIRGAQSELSDDRRQQVESANQEFTSQLQETLKTVGTSTTGADAASTISAAAQQLASSYEQTFARIDCS